MREDERQVTSDQSTVTSSGKAAASATPSLSTQHSELSIYTEKWFRDRMGYRKAYHAFAAAIEEVFNPESFLDVGCGAGFILEWFLTSDNAPGVGIEGCPNAFRVMAPVVRPVVYERDLRQPCDLALDWVDLTVSIEVAEHIEREHVEHFLDWITQGRRLFLSAAPPGQANGLYHVNEQPFTYWVELLSRRGWRLNLTDTDRWRIAARARTSGCPWVVRNSLYFEREAQDHV